MTTIVQPWKKGYKVYFCDDAKAGKIKHVGTVELEETSKGIRPSEFFVRRPGTSHAGKDAHKGVHYGPSGKRTDQTYPDHAGISGFPQRHAFILGDNDPLPDLSV